MGFQGLTVFISSSISEFSNLRVRMISEIKRFGFLTPVILEHEGARPVPVEEESMNKAGECDIFVGIFGEKYSDLTAKEFRKAIGEGKPCFIYVLGGVVREGRLQEFLDKEVKPSVKYQEFSTNSDAIDIMTKDLSIFTGEVLRRGIGTWSRQGVIGSGQMQKVESNAFGTVGGGLVGKVEAVETATIKEHVSVTKIDYGDPQRIQVLTALSTTERMSMKRLSELTVIYPGILWLRLVNLANKGQVRIVKTVNPRRTWYSITEAGMSALKNWQDRHQK